MSTSWKAILIWHHCCTSVNTLVQVVVNIFQATFDFVHRLLRFMLVFFFLSFLLVIFLVLSFAVENCKMCVPPQLHSHSLYIVLSSLSMQDSLSVRVDEKIKMRCITLPFNCIVGLLDRKPHQVKINAFSGKRCIMLVLTIVHDESSVPHQTTSITKTLSYSGSRN